MELTTVQKLEALVKEVAEQHPSFGLSFGYIGNCDLYGDRYDDRSWSVFAKLATRDCIGACNVSYGGYPTNALIHFLRVAELGLATWAEKQEARLNSGEIKIVGAK